MFWKKSVVGSTAMLMCLSRQLVSFKIPLAPIVVLNRGYTHAKSKVNAESHLYKEQLSKARESPKARRKDEKIVVDPKNDYNFRECRIFVEKIPLTANWKDVKDHFKDWGVNFVTISKDPVTNEPKGCGIVQFDSEVQAIKAVEGLQGSVLRGSALNMWLDRKRNTKEVVNSEGKESKVEKTLHSLPYSSKMRGDVKSSKELDSFQKERRGREDDQNERKTSERSPRDARVGESRRGQEETRKEQGKELSPSAGSNNDKPVEGNYKFQATFFKRDPDDKTSMSTEELNEIEFLVDSRADCRDYGNYPAADEIRLRLRNEFRVQCDDVRKTWRILSPFMADGTPRPNRAR